MIRLAFFYRRAALVLTASALLICLNACALLPSQSGGEGSAPIQLLPVAQSNPSDTARAFIEAWGRREYDAMYALLSPESQRLIGIPVFRATYQQVDDQIGTVGASMTPRETTEQGITAAVRYDLELQTDNFGIIRDEGRTIRLARAADNSWRVAWSTMDIFDGYAPNTRLEAQTRREPRGHILDHDGQFVVEQNGETVTLYSARQEIPNLEGCLDLLATILRRERAQLAALVATYNPETVFPIGDIDPAEFAASQGALAEICNIRTATRTTRRYVGHGIATHVTGYVGQIPGEQLEAYLGRGYGQGDLVGRGGVEAVYETELAGSPSRFLRIIEPGGLVVRELAGAEGVSPQSVTLTLDIDLQRVTAQALSDAYNYAVANWGSRTHSGGGGAVVLDVNTGAVLALASYPTYDPGIFNPDTPMFQVSTIIGQLNSDTRQPFFNRVTQNSYAPGSSFKIVTTAAAAAERIFSPTEVFYCGMQWDGRSFGDTQPVRLDWRATEPEEFRFDTGEVTMANALTASCNPFFYQMGALLYRRSPTLLTDYARRMGLGRATGLSPLLPEVAGQIPPPTSVEEAINIAIGQHETQVTIIQMARMVAGIANGGTLYQPYLVQRVGVAGEPPTFEAQPQIVGEMGLSADVLALVRQGMCDVTKSDVLGRSTGKPLGTAWFVFDDPSGVPAPYRVCGKTGTAQTGRIEPHGWFVAYAPAENPQIAIAVMIENGREGSETAAPIVRRILDFYFNAQPAPFPNWWQGDYVPLTIPVGGTGG